MRSRCPGLVVGTLSLIAVSTLAGPVQSEEFQCRRGDLVRRIELQFADDADRLPCQVVYWKDQESPGEPRVPWKAEQRPRVLRRQGARNGRRLAERGLELRWRRAAVPRMLRSWTRSSHPKDLRANRPRRRRAPATRRCRGPRSRHPRDPPANGRAAARRRPTMPRTESRHPQDPPANRPRQLQRPAARRCCERRRHV